MFILNNKMIIFGTYKASGKGENYKIESVIK